MDHTPFEPISPDKFSRDLAEGINSLWSNPELCKKMAIAGRKRVEDTFSWTSIAKQTVELYNSLKK